MLKTNKNKKLIPDERKIIWDESLDLPSKVAEVSKAANKVLEHGNSDKKAPSSSVEHDAKGQCNCKTPCKDAYGGTDCPSPYPSIDNAKPIDEDVIQAMKTQVEQYLWPIK